MKIAWIGFGIMGSRMVKHLTSHYEVQGYNRTQSKIPSTDTPITVHNTIPSCIREARIIFLMLSTPQVVESVVKNDIFPYALKGSIIIDMSTNLPSLTITLAQAASALGLHWIDAPVSGGLQGASNATLSIMVGGESSIFDQVLPLLQCLGNRIVHCGVHGQGQHAKMANQIAVAHNLCGLLESLEYAYHQDLPLPEVLSLLSNGAASSWQIQHNGPLLLSEDMNPGFIFAHFHKDLQCIISEIQKRGLHLPLITHIAHIVESMINQSNGNLSTLALIQYYRTHNATLSTIHQSHSSHQQ